MCGAAVFGPDEGLLVRVPVARWRAGRPSYRRILVMAPRRNMQSDAEAQK